MRSGGQEVRRNFGFATFPNVPICIRFNMTYWFLTSGNSQRDYSTFFEASTKCYPPLVESPLCTESEPGPVGFLTMDRHVLLAREVLAAALGEGGSLMPEHRDLVPGTGRSASD